MRCSTGSAKQPSKRGTDGGARSKAGASGGAKRGKGSRPVDDDEAAPKKGGPKKAVPKRVAPKSKTAQARSAENGSKSQNKARSGGKKKR